MATLLITSLSIFSICAKSQCLHESDVDCGAQAVNLGAHATPESCAWDAAVQTQCGDYFMFSEYSSWGCRCCSLNGGELGGTANTNWDLFSVEGCGATKIPTASEPPTSSPTTPTPTALPTPPTLAPTNECFDYSRGGCWDLGVKDYLADDEACRRYCAILPGCEHWSYHPLRGDRRCHVCSLDEDWSTCDEAGSCVWGPAVCPGDAAQNASTILFDAVRVAQAYCDGGDAAPTSAEMLIAAENMNELVNNLDLYFTNQDVLDAAATEAASVLADIACVTSANTASPCDHGGLLMHQLRGFVLLFDDESVRAFADATDARKGIWDAHRVLIADHAWFNANTLDAIRLFFDDLPAHLLADGVLFEAPFATLTARDAFECESNSDAFELHFTERGFNVFQTQVGQVTENAFPADADAVRGDLCMTVVRHETAHQFDRVVAADVRLSALKQLLMDACDADEDYLRSQVGHAYFEAAPQELIASQVGNQYLLDTRAQLALAVDRFVDTPLPLSWMLFLFDVIGGSDAGSTVMYKESSSETGVTATATAQLTRDAEGRIVGLMVPGCDAFTFAYDAETGLVESYTAPEVCVVDFASDSPSLFPTEMPTHVDTTEMPTTEMPSQTQTPATPTEMEAEPTSSDIAYRDGTACLVVCVLLLNV